LNPLSALQKLPRLTLAILTPKVKLKFKKELACIFVSLSKKYAKLLKEEASQKSSPQFKEASSKVGLKICVDKLLWQLQPQ